MSTTTCDDDGTQRQAIDAGLGIEPSPGDITTDLLGDGAEDPAWSLRRDVDVHGAIVRGLAQYLWTMTASLGRAIRFNRVTEEQADAFDEALPYPVAAVYGGGEDGTYESPRQSTPAIGADRQPVVFTEPDGAHAGLFINGTYAHRRLMVDVLSASKPEQAAIVAALEDLFEPSPGRVGFALRLRHYHGAVARYVMTAQGRDNAAASSGSWGLRFRLTAAAPLVRVHRRPLTTIRVVSTVGTAPLPE